jgi:DNA-binding NarL/FixJ family response regulator
LHDEPLHLAEPLDGPGLWDSEPAVALLAAEPVLRRRIVSVLDYDRLTIAAQGADWGAVLAAAREASARALVVAVPHVEQAVDVVHDACDAGVAAHAIAVVRHHESRAVRGALREGVDAVVWEDQVEIALPLAVRGAGLGMAVIPREAGDRLEPPALSHRERQVLALAADGATNPEIARRLMVSLSTVKTHLSSSFAKLGVGGRSEALAALLDESAPVLTPSVESPAR